MNLNQVCLCYEAFQEIEGRFVSICEPVLSTPINNMSKFKKIKKKINFKVANKFFCSRKCTNGRTKNYTT